MLPTCLTPEDRESLSGFLCRVARQLWLPVGEFVAQVYPAARDQSNSLGFRFVPSGGITSIARELSLDPDVVRGATLLRFPAFVAIPEMRDLGIKGRPLGAQRAHWWQFDTDRYCPVCLCNGSGWSVDWTHPWTFVCREHRVVLRHTCTTCGRPARILVRAAGGATDLACACGSRWGDNRSVLADVEEVVLQNRLTSVVGDEQPVTLWSRTASHSQVLEAWRAGAALLAGIADIPRWALRPWLSPPPPATARRALRAAACVVTATSTDQAADALRVLFDADDATISRRIHDRLPAHTALDPVITKWQRTRVRVSTRLAHERGEDRQCAAGTRRPLPTLAPLDLLPAHWREPGKPHLLLRRTAVSLAAARLDGADTWAAAATRIGVTPAFASRTSRYITRVLGPESADVMSQAARRLLSHRHDVAVARPAVDSFRALRAFAESAERPS